MQERSQITVPAREDLELIAAELGAASNRVGGFTSSIIRFAQVLDYSRRKGVTFREARQRSNLALRKVKKSLETALEAATSEQSLLTHTISQAFADDLGSVISLPGIRHLIDSQLFFSFDERDVELAAGRSRDGGAEWVINEMQNRIPAVVADHPAKTLSNLLNLILQAIDTEIAVNSSHLRGRPRNTEREYALDLLKQVHDETFDARATTAPGGTFNRMCEAVFDSLGLDDTGLQTAIERRLRK